MKTHFTKKRPSRSGNYLVKDENGETWITTIYWSPDDRTWWRFSYPNANVSEQLEEGDIYKWGPRVD